MTLNAALSAGWLVQADGEPERLRSLIDWPALRQLGWDPKREVFGPAADDPVLGFDECVTAGCDQVSETNRWGLCCGCLTRWRRSCPDASLEELCATAPPRANKKIGGLCLVCRVPGHERPAHWQGLCGSCVSTMGQRGQDVAGYINGDGEFAPAVPRPSFGGCQVATCTRWSAHREPALCDTHYISWVRSGQHSRQSLAVWCSRQKMLDYDGRTVVLRGLGERAQLEMLYGLWCRAQAERRTTPQVAQMVVNLLWSPGAVSVVDLIESSGCGSEFRDDRYGESKGSEFRGCRASSATSQQLHSDAGAPNPLARKRDRRRFEMATGWVDVRRISQPKLDVDRRGNADQFRDFVVTKNAANIVGRLDVDVERHVDGGADRRDLSQRQICRNIDCRGSKVCENACRSRICCRKHHGRFGLHVCRKEVASSASEGVQDADVRDQHRPEPMLSSADAIFQIGDHLLLPVRRRCEAGVNTGGSGEAPSTVWTREQRHLYLCARGESRHLVEFRVRVEEDSGALGHSVYTHVEQLCLGEDCLGASRSFDRGNLHAILRTIREPLSRSRYHKRICAWQIETYQEIANTVRSGHHVMLTLLSSDGANETR
jgi:hypothetical protein